MDFHWRWPSSPISEQVRTSVDMRQQFSAGTTVLDLLVKVGGSHWSRDRPMPPAGTLLKAPIWSSELERWQPFRTAMARVPLVFQETEEPGHVKSYTPAQGGMLHRVTGHIWNDGAYCCTEE